MKNYAVKRILISLVTFFGITFIVFLLVNAAPGNPVDMMLDVNASIEMREMMEAKLGLDQPLLVRYWNWLTQMLSGSMGTSYRTLSPVWQELAARIGPTLLLTFAALLLALLVSVPLGTAAAYRPYSWIDYISSGLSFLGAATPNFFLGLVFIYFFALKLNILPISGMYDSLADKNLVSLLRHLLMPAVVLSMQMVGNLLRQTRSSMLDCLNDDYVNTARSKGLGERAVVFGHALKNACIPLLSQIGLSLPTLIGGAVVTEQIFNWPGLGSLMVVSISSRDYPMIMGITTITSLFVLAGNIIIDVLYGVLDPRIRRNRKN